MKCKYLYDHLLPETSKNDVPNIINNIQGDPPNMFTHMFKYTE